MKNGFLLVDKPQGMTCNDIVYKARRATGIKKIGHSGTLDPDTTGLVVLAINRATRYLPILTTNSTKTYFASAQFGMLTDTLDSSGTILEKTDFTCTKEKLLEILKSFEKTYMQMPPIYSAKKVNGKRLYDYARSNQEVEIKPSEVTIHSIKLLEFSDSSFDFEVTVSKGTYIRSLILDIAASLDTIATMTDLRRTATDGFDVKQAVMLDDITSDDIVDLESYVCEIYQTYEVYDKIATLISNGALLRYKPEFNYPCVYIDSSTKKCLAIYDRFGDNIKPIMMF